MNIILLKVSVLITLYTIRLLYSSYYMLACKVAIEFQEIFIWVENEFIIIQLSTCVHPYTN